MTPLEGAHKSLTLVRIGWGWMCIVEHCQTTPWTSEWKMLRGCLGGGLPSGRDSRATFSGSPSLQESGIQRLPIAPRLTNIRTDMPRQRKPPHYLTASLVSAVEHTMRVGIYARVSTRDQSCEMQLRDLRAYCAARQLTVVREYVDLGVSGTKDSRPQLNELMGDARKRKLDAVLVFRFDRFARSSRHLLIALEEFRALGVQFVSYQENLDTSSPLGQAIFTIISAVAQLERDIICERVSAGIRNARAKGKRLGRPRQYVDIDRVLEMRASGMSLGRIAATLKIGYGTIRERLDANRRKNQPEKPGNAAASMECPALLEVS